MKLVAVVALVVSIVSLVLILRLTLMEQRHSEPAISLPRPQPTPTRCESLTQLLADAQSERGAAVFVQQLSNAKCRNIGLRPQSDEEIIARLFPEGLAPLTPEK